jgi:hypothetical protein
VLFYYPQYPKPRFLVHLLTESTLVGTQWLKIYVMSEKFTPYLAPSIICSTKEKNQKSDDMDRIYNRIWKWIQNAQPDNLKNVGAQMGWRKSCNFNIVISRALFTQSSFNSLRNNGNVGISSQWYFYWSNVTNMSSP